MPPWCMRPGQAGGHPAVVLTTIPSVRPRNACASVINAPSLAGRSIKIDVTGDTTITYIYCYEEPSGAVARSPGQRQSTVERGRDTADRASIINGLAAPRRAAPGPAGPGRPAYVAMHVTIANRASHIPSTRSSLSGGRTVADGHAGRVDVVVWRSHKRRRVAASVKFQQIKS